MEPAGIEPATSCLQRRPGTWRVGPIVPRCLILRGIVGTATLAGSGCFPHLLRPCFVPADRDTSASFRHPHPRRPQLSGIAEWPGAAS
jgi:hypothetical protein